MSLGPVTGSGFPPDEAALSVTIDGTGSGATGTIQTDGSGDAIGTAVITSPGSGYKVGDIVSLTDNNGVATATVESIT